MLAEIIFASVPPQKERDKERAYSGLSCSQLYPCPYRMYLVHKGRKWEAPTPQQILNMEDGWPAEEQAVWRLKRAGIEVYSRGPNERYVEVGRSNIPGSIDGIVKLVSIEYLWDHKAMNGESFWLLKNKGIEAFPSIKCQMNSYMIGKGLNKAIVQAKCKENNDIYDVILDLDLGFIMPILDIADEIRLGNLIPGPKQCDLCTSCGVNCFEDLKFDFSKMGTFTAPEAIEKYRQGKKYQIVGKILEDEARSILIGYKGLEGEWVPGLIGDKEIAYFDDVKVSKIVSHRFDIDKGLLLKEYGPDALVKVGRESTTEYYRIYDKTLKEEKE